MFDHSKGLYYMGGSFKLAEQFKAQRFIPDLICGHSGWGPTLFTKDVFPDTPYFVILNGFIMPMVQMQILAEPLSADDVADSVKMHQSC